MAPCHKPRWSYWTRGERFKMGFEKNQIVLHSSKRYDKSLFVVFICSFRYTDQLKVWFNSCSVASISFKF